MSTAMIESEPTVCGECPHMSMELGEGTWKLGFTIGFGEKFLPTGPSLDSVGNGNAWSCVPR